MDGVKNIQLGDYEINEAFSASCTVAGDESCTECIYVPVERGADVVHLERLQRYASHLELLLLRKNSEICELQRVMEAHFEEMQRKQIEQTRVMIHQARLAAMGEMLGAIAHHWRQPLHIISLVVQNMKDAKEYGEFNEELLDRTIFQTMEQVMYLTRTIDDFRMFLKPSETGSNFNPIQCVEESVGLLSGWFSNFPDIEVRKSGITEENFRITGCEDSFKQVIISLFKNANEAVQEQQRRIGSTFRGRIIIDFHCRDDEAIIEVADNGGGIADSTMEHVFDPYFTTKVKSNGIGIGLYVSRLIIENSMNGSLWGENIPGGALFSIRLPLAMVEGGRI